MGCDIHLYLEYRKSKNEEWKNLDLYEKNPYYGERGEPEYSMVPCYRYRDYELFNVLAGVRGSDEEAISIPRGLPEDVTKETKEYSDKWGSDGHSHSYLTLAELLEYQKQNTIVKRSGMLSEQQLEDMKKGIKPDHWCGWTNMEGFVFAEWEDEHDVMTVLINRIMSRLEDHYFWKDYIRKNVNNIRIVFFFDN